MKKEYLQYITIITILIQMLLGLLDVITDIDYAANARKSSVEISLASGFFVIFPPFCQMVSWTYIFIQIEMLENRLEDKYMSRICYHENRINGAETFQQFVLYTLEYKISEMWNIIKLLKHTPRGMMHGIFQYLKVLPVYLYYKYRNNNQISQQYENIFKKRYTNQCSKLQQKILARTRKAMSQNIKQVLPISLSKDIDGETS